MSATEQSINDRLDAYLSPSEDQPAEPAADTPPEENLVERPAIQAERAEQTEEPQAAEEQPELQAEDPAEPEAQAEESQPDDDGLTISTLQELAEYNEIDPSDLYKLSIPVKDPDGLEVSMTLGDIKDSVQDVRRAERIRTEAEELKTALESQRAQAAEQFENQAEQVGAALTQSHQLLMHEYNSIDWDTLRANNPTEWAAKRQEMQERDTQLRNIYQHVDQRYKQMLAEKEQQEEVRFREKLQREDVELLNRIPEWRDEGVRKAEVSEIRDFLLDSGYTAEDLDNTKSPWQLDHRLIALGRDAMRYQKRHKAGNVALKKVPKGIKAPLKPGSRQTKANRNQDKVASLRGQLRKSGRIEDAYALYTAIEKGG